MPNTFDVDALIEELELDQEDIVELLADFKDFIEETLPQLVSAVQEQNITESRSLSHSIKGSAGNLRINKVYETAKKMQDAADAKDGETLNTLLPEIQTNVKDFLDELATL